jgi:hypothetical protein
MQVLTVKMPFPGKNAISWLGFSQAFFGVESKTAFVLGWGMTLGTIVGLSWVWWAGGRQADLTSQMGLASVCLVLIPPHIMYYDMGLLFFTYAALIIKKGKISFTNRDCVASRI